MTERKYVAVIGNTEVVFYSSHRAGSRANREDLVAEIRRCFSRSDSRDLLCRRAAVMLDCRD